MSDPFLGEIRLVAFNYAPDGWVLCQGQTLAISQYQALYSLLGTTFGGDGVRTFQVPDLRGRVATQFGPGPTGTTVFGQAGGTGAVTAQAQGAVMLTEQNMPAHTHGATFTGTGGGATVQPTITVKVSTDQATAAAAPANGFLATAKAAGLGAVTNIYSAGAASGTTTLNAQTAVATGGSGGGITGGTVAIASAGQAQPAPVPVSVNVSVPAALPPFLAMNYMMATGGIYPPRP